MSTEKGKAIVSIDIEGEDLDDAADKLVETLKGHGLNAEVEEVVEDGDPAAQAADADEEEQAGDGGEGSGSET